MLEVKENRENNKDKTLEFITIKNNLKYRFNKVIIWSLFSFNSMYSNFEN